MEPTQYLERWIWLGLTLLALTLLSPPAVLLGLVLWLWVQWKPHARLPWIVAGGLLLLSWGGLALLWGMLVAHLLALRLALQGLADPEVLLARIWPVWAEGTLLFPSIAVVVHLFRPTKPGGSALAQTAVPPESALEQGQAAPIPVAGAANRWSKTRSDVRPDHHQQPPSPLAS